MEHVFTIQTEIDIDYNSAKPQGFSYESRRAQATISYVMTIEMREWGVKGISFFVPDQEITIILELTEDGEEDPEDFDCKVNLKNCDIDATNFKLNSDISPEALILVLEKFKMKPTRNTVEFEAEASGELVFKPSDDD